MLSSEPIRRMVRCKVYSRSVSSIVLVRTRWACLSIGSTRFACAHIPTIPGVVYRLATVGARVSPLAEIVLKMPPYSIIRACGCTDIARNGLSACVTNLLYVAFAVKFAEYVAAAKSGSRSSNTM